VIGDGLVVLGLDERETAGDVLARVMDGGSGIALWPSAWGGVMSPNEWDSPLVAARRRWGDGGHETSRLLGAVERTPSRRERRTSSLQFLDGRRKGVRVTAAERSEGWVWDLGRGLQMGIPCDTERVWMWDTVFARGMRERTGDGLMRRTRWGDGERERQSYFWDDDELSEPSGL
jgi:hypothetical protein